MLKLSVYIKKEEELKWSFKQYVHTIKSSDVIGTAQYIGNGNGPLLPIELKQSNIYTQIFKTHHLLHHRGRDEVVRYFR